MTTAAPVDPLTPPPSAHRVVVTDGEAVIWQPRADIVVQRASGILSLPLAHCFGEFYRPILVPGANLHIFDDFASLMLYTREAREYLTELTTRHQFAIAEIHFLLSSKLMALGVSAFKHDVADTRMHAYSDRDSFVASYMAALGAAPS